MCVRAPDDVEELLRTLGGGGLVAQTSHTRTRCKCTVGWN